MTGRIIILNGASSSGKTTLARALQDELPGDWLRLSIDDLVAALPTKLRSGGGIEFGPQGEVTVGEAFRRLERAWMIGISGTVQAGLTARPACTVNSAARCIRVWCTTSRWIRQSWSRWPWRGSSGMT